MLYKMNYSCTHMATVGVRGLTARPVLCDVRFTVDYKATVRYGT